ncbi:MAG: alcohol dehydrogenase catalytic domain-containing protein [Chloroflexi bacterium]|nr:alcohol dehydrogenase catalytic domain-containing protein [Chloroflexota bacterium]
MRALVLETPGETPSMAVRERAVPLIGPNDVLVKVEAAGLCGHDVAVMRGLLRRGVRPDAVLGHEVSGRVAEVGDAVTSLRVGDAVVSALTTFCGNCDRCISGNDYRCPNGHGVGHGIDGGFAEFVALPATSAVPVPDGLDLETACLLSCPTGVALRAARDVARVQPGETVLVTGAGGGLGVHSALVAAALGARVLAVTASPEKVARIEDLGIEEVLLVDDLPFSELALALTEDRGVDIVLDSVGSAVFEQAIRSISDGGRIVLMGEVTGSKAEVSPAEIMFRDATVTGSTGASIGHVTDAAAMVAAGKMSPVVSERFPLEEAAEAYRLMRERKIFGRVLLVP